MMRMGVTEGDRFSTAMAGVLTSADTRAPATSASVIGGRSVRTATPPSVVALSAADPAGGVATPPSAAALSTADPAGGDEAPPSAAALSTADSGNTGASSLVASPDG